VIYSTTDYTLVNERHWLNKLYPHLYAAIPIRNPHHFLNIKETPGWVSLERTQKLDEWLTGLLDRHGSILALAESDAAAR